MSMGCVLHIIFNKIIFDEFFLFETFFILSTYFRVLRILIGKLDDRRSKSSCSTGKTPQQLLLENSTAFGDCKITNV